MKALGKAWLWYTLGIVSGTWATFVLYEAGVVAAMQEGMK